MAAVEQTQAYDALPDELQRRFDDYRAEHPVVAGLWRGEPAPRQNDVSASGFEFALVWRLKRQGFTATECAQIIAVYPHRSEKHEGELRRRVANAWINSKAEPEIAPRNNGTVLEPRPPGLSDDLLALRFAEEEAKSLRYVAMLGKWLWWDGQRWRFDETLIARARARGLCRRVSIRCEPKVEKQIASAKTIAAVERLAQADPRIAATVNQWDADSWLLNTPAGTINLQTGERKAHAPGDLITKITGVAPDDSCPTPTWNSFLSRVTDNNQDLIGYLQRMAGYSLTGLTREHALFFVYGLAANGKTTFLNAIIACAGEYHRTAPIETFTASKHGNGNRNRRWTPLGGK
jgi:phage/plasmid-associated DNA primase